VTANEALRKYTSILLQHGLDEAVDEAKVLLCNVLGLSSAQLFAQPDRAVSDEEADRLNGLIEKRISGVPVAYLINYREFYGIGLYIDSRVLIPRSETEVLVEEAIGFHRRWARQHNGVMKIADVGTGSGAIALALAANIPDSLVYAIDISEDALKVAGTNVKNHKLEDRIKLVQGNLLQKISGKVDMIVANLPYIKEAEVPLLPVEISKYEPRQALDGGIPGTEVIRKLIEQSAGRVNEGGVILIEIGMGQEDEISKIIAGALPGAQIKLVKDLAGINRVMKIEMMGFDNHIGLL
jgi:release factor glutamine methyltransferase